MVGDWGKDGDHSAQSRVAAAMAAYTQTNRLHPEAMFFLGDNIYGALPGGPDDPRFQTQFEAMYPAVTFPSPAYMVLGNHDYQRLPATVDKVEAELAYARRGHTRWTQPARWYAFDLPGKKPLIKVIALDSNLPPANHKEDGFNLFLTPAQQAEQTAWLTAELAKPRKAPFLVVMAHHPLYSNGKHGDSPHLIDEWSSLLQQHRVHLYLCGHDHDLQHLEFEGHPTSFVLSGGGGADLYDIKLPNRGPYSQKVYGFTHLEATRHRLIVRHLDVEGKVIHSFSKFKDGTIALA
jgi:3',5'-cyclic AMP phosphodiesterase CpdA